MKEINEIDIDTELGQYLLAAIAIISRESQTDKTPNEILLKIGELKKEMFEKQLKQRQ